MPVRTHDEYFIKVAGILKQNPLLERAGEVSYVQLSRGAVPGQNDLAHNVLRMPLTRDVRNAASIRDFLRCVAGLPAQRALAAAVAIGQGVGVPVYTKDAQATRGGVHRLNIWDRLVFLFTCELCAYGVCCGCGRQCAACTG